MNLDPTEVYGLYLGIKLHFTSDSYDYFRYGKKKISREKFLERKDKNTFIKLSKLYDEAQLTDLLVANMLHSQKTWSGDLLSKDSHQIYISYLKHKESLEYHFKEDLGRLLDKVEKPDDMFKSINGQNPVILNMLYTEKITTETFIILASIFDFTEMYKQIDDDILLPKYLKLIDKYKPFVRFDREEYKKLLMNLINNR